MRPNEVKRTSLDIFKANQNLCWKPMLNVYDVIDRLVEFTCIEER